MTTVTGLTAERMLEIEAASVVDGDVSGDTLFLTRKDGTLINAGSVRGPIGPTGPMGHSLSVVSAQPVLDIGVINQIRAGRQLTVADFTNMGLSAPAGLWNLSNLNDSSGNGRNLQNKGAVPFDTGINGGAASAARFSGSTAQALYIPDSGAADSLRIRTGSFGCWMKTAKRATGQYFLAKASSSAGQFSYWMSVGATNSLFVQASTTGTDTGGVTGISDIADDRWHFCVSTNDGTKLRIYVDGVLENSVNTGVMFLGTGPFNIGSYGADSSVAGASAFFGRVDEAFVTHDVLSEEQIRNLYAASFSHSLGEIPNSAYLSVHRRKRGAPLAASDFPSQPVRLYNFTGGVLTDEGANNVSLVGQGTTTGLVDSAGVDGALQGGKALSGAHLGFASTDAGLPSGLASRSFGLWAKTNVAGQQQLMGWGGPVNTADTRISIGSTGVVQSVNQADAAVGLFIADGQWHHIVSVEDNAATDGLKRKLYIDGRLVATSLNMFSLTLGGANRFRLGAFHDGSGGALGGQIDGAFVFAGALTGEQVRTLYNKGSQALAPSPKVAADNIEAFEAGRVLAIFDTIEASDSINLAVTA